QDESRRDYGCFDNEDSIIVSGEYSQWRERFMNYLEGQIDDEPMINSIQNGDQPFPVIAQVSLARNAHNAPPTLKDLKFWTTEEKKTRNIDRDVNDALGYKKKVVVVTLDPLALVAKKTKVSKRKEKVVVSSDSKGSGADDFSELKKIAALLAKAFNQRKFYSKPTNNNLRTSSTSQSANKKQEFVKSDDKKNADLIAQTEVLKDQLKVKHVVIDTHTECQAKYAKLEEERYEYMIRYSALCDNDKQHRKKIDEQEIFFDKMSRCVSNKDVEIEKCLERLNECENKLHKIRQTNQTIHIIMPSKDTLYNGRKGIGFENLSYFEKAKDLRPSLYDEKVIGLRYTLMFLIHSNEALEIKKFKRARENKIFACDYGNLNASYVNEKIHFSDDYFQEIINSDFEKIDSPFQQTSSLKPYVPNVILEKIIIDLEEEVVSLLEKKKQT
nr:hypothetical protein [Tanacetum cinerariifolium]